MFFFFCFFFFSSRRRHTRWNCDWSSDVCSSDLWVGNVSAGLGHCYRRAAERDLPRSIQIVDHSNFSIALALLGGALGAPFIPARTLLGSDITARADGEHLRRGTSPIADEQLIFVPAVIPDV